MSPQTMVNLQWSEEKYDGCFARAFALGLAAMYHREHLSYALISSTHQSIPAPQRCLGEAPLKLTLTNHLL